MIPNVLAQRYASPAMATIWAPDHRIVAERRLWLAVLDAQADLGLDIPDGVITDYARVIDQIDLVSIARRERMTRHDVKARIEEFNALAGHEHIHMGLTSRDLTENVEQMLIRDEMPICPLFNYVVIMFYNDRLGGIQGNLTDEHPFRAMYWKKR